MIEVRLKQKISVLSIRLHALTLITLPPQIDWFLFSE